MLEKHVSLVPRQHITDETLDGIPIIDCSLQDLYSLLSAYPLYKTFIDMLHSIGAFGVNESYKIRFWVRKKNPEGALVEMIMTFPAKDYKPLPPQETSDSGCIFVHMAMFSDFPIE